MSFLHHLSSFFTIARLHVVSIQKLRLFHCLLLFARDVIYVITSTRTINPCGDIEREMKKIRCFLLSHDIYQKN